MDPGWLPALVRVAPTAASVTQCREGSAGLPCSGDLQVAAMDYLSDNDGFVLVNGLSAPANQISLERTTDAGSSWATIASWSVGN